MNKLLVIIPILAVIGCATFSENARKTIYGADRLADSAMKGWAVYYKEATNNPAQFNETLIDVERQHQQVNSLARETGAALGTAHTMVDAYEKGLATKSQVQSAIDSAAASAPSLVRLIVSVTGNTNLLNAVK